MSDPSHDVQLQTALQVYALVAFIGVVAVMSDQSIDLLYDFSQ